MKDKKLFLIVAAFSLVYSVVFKQGVLLLIDYLTVPINELVYHWQSYLAFFMFNLLVAQTTAKYFAKRHPFYFSIMVGGGSAIFSSLAELPIALLWALLLSNAIMSVLALLTQKRLETVSIQKSNDDNR